MATRRREFLSAGVAALGGAAAPAAAEPGAPGEPPRVFDAHLHCPADSGELWQWHTVTPTFRDFVAHLDRTGVQRGIINSQRAQSNGGTPAEFIAGNREVARFAEKSKGRFVGACVVNPQFIDEALKEVEYCRKQLGFVWVGELCNYMIPYEYTIKEFELLVEQVVKLGMILDVHTNHEEMDYIIRSFPEATLVFPHFGGHGSIFKRIDLIAENPNCYIDTSGSGYDRMGMLEYAVEKFGPNRVLFGSDFSINDPSSVLARIESSFLSADERARVLSGNLEALLARFTSP